ncbi:MAG TPA: dTDP-glucose 4,6-dehydratase [archaeon]|nr:dTDP-glucose 4,6-dehydratase [archaeon]
MSYSKILVTGGCGFMGSAFIRRMSKKASLTNIDKLTYAGNLANVKGFSHKFVKGDIANKSLVEKAAKDADVIVNYAAETHVDRSIKNAESFVKSNVLGTFVLLEAARKYDARFIQISTDEVYGSAQQGKFSEFSPLQPNSPYAASKTSADMFVRSFVQTYELDAVIARSCNVFGPYQFPEKFMPLSITNILQGRKIPIYGDGKNVREWIYVDDHASAIEFIMNSVREKIINIGTGNEKRNVEVARLVLSLLGMQENMLEFVADRKGHDYRYAMDWRVLSRLGWKPEHKFEDGLQRTINWYKENEKWWKPLL